MSDQPFFDLAPILANLSPLLKGFGIALISATGGTVLAVIVGAVVAALRLSSIPPLRWFAFGYTQLFRGIPLYVLIMWVYFGLAIVVGLNIPAIPAGILTLALLNSGYLAETFRSSYASIDRGQHEAGLALGLSGAAIRRHVLLPQAARVAIPPSGNQYVDAIKDSAILSVIGVPELLRQSQQLANLYYRPFEFYTFAGLLYLLAVLIVSRLMRLLEGRISNRTASAAVVDHRGGSPMTEGGEATSLQAPPASSVSSRSPR